MTALMYLQDEMFYMILSGSEQLNIMQLAKLENLLELKAYITTDHNTELTKTFITRLLDFADDIRASQKEKAICSWKAKEGET